MNQSIPIANLSQSVFLGHWDFVVIGTMMFISAGIGLYFRFSGGQQKTTQEFFMAGRNMPIFPVAFSIMASGNSAITYLGIASDTYVYGTLFVFINLGILAGALTAGYLFLPVFFNSNIRTTYEYLEKRFGGCLRTICSMGFCVQSMLYIAVVLYAPALALSAVTNLSIWASVLSIGVVCTFYCTLGGMKAVLWTDVLQALMMYGGLFALIAKGCADVGGFETVLKRSQEGGRVIIPGFQIDFTTRYTLLNTFMCGFVTTLSAYGASQMQVQRLLTVDSVTKARRALYFSLPISFIFLIVNCFSGLVVYASFYRCDPLTSGQNAITKPDQLLPYFVLRSLGSYPGMAGFCICGMLSAALSTMSSMVNSLTTVTVEDFMRPFCPIMNDSTVAIVAKFITLCYGGVALLLTCIVAHFGNVLQASNIVYGLVAGPVLGVFVLGILTTRSNEKGVIIGLFVSMAITAWISISGASANIAHPKLPVSIAECPHIHLLSNQSTSGTTSSHLWLEDSAKVHISSTTHPHLEGEERYTFPLHRVSYMWFSPIGAFVTIFVGYISSYIFAKPSNIDKNLLNSVTRRFTTVAKHKENNVELKDINADTGVEGDKKKF